LAGPSFSSSNAELSNSKRKYDEQRLAGEQSGAFKRIDHRLYSGAEFGEHSLSNLPTGCLRLAGEPVGVNKPFLSSRKHKPGSDSSGDACWSVLRFDVGFIQHGILEDKPFDGKERQCAKASRWAVPLKLRFGDITQGQLTTAERTVE
jgi:hypothetical protein